jgi:transposase
VNSLCTTAVDGYLLVRADECRGDGICEGSSGLDELIGLPRVPWRLRPLGRLGFMVSRKPYPDELRERAVQMVFELQAETGNARGSIARVGQRLGINTETLRNWVNKAEVDSGERPGTATVDKKRIAEPEREVRELRRANEILKAASAYFARELDPRHPR